MTPKDRTKLVLAAAVAGLALYDVITYAKDGGDATISTVTYESLAEYPIIGIAVGAVIGHIAASMPGVKIINPDGA